jgi:D-alanyl-D-alanine endopeptidase (penicillin-binding protein 7)
MPGLVPRVVVRPLLAVAVAVSFGLPSPVGASTATASQAAPQGVAQPTRSQTPSGTKSAVRKPTTRKRVVRAKTTRRPPTKAELRRARLARARAAQQQRELRELALPRYKTDVAGSLVPDVRAAAAVVYNPVTHEVLWAENETQARSIASITKVMTAVVFLEHEFDLNREVTVDSADLRAVSVTYLRRGDRLHVDDLLHLLLIASDNGAARTLARVSPFGPQGFIERMNAKAVALGLTSTRYADPSGLDSNNISSAYDMARLIAFAASDERIAPIMRMADYSVKVGARTVAVHNTNRLVGTDMDVRGGKTGFISKAGYCLATLLTLPATGDQVAVVVLGARSNAARFSETRHIFNWLATKTSQVVSGASKTH